MPLVACVRREHSQQRPTPIDQGLAHPGISGKPDWRFEEGGPNSRHGWAIGGAHSRKLDRTERDSCVLPGGQWCERRERSRSALKAGGCTIPQLTDCGEAPTRKGASIGLDDVAVVEDLSDRLGSLRSGVTTSTVGTFRKRIGRLPEDPGRAFFGVAAYDVDLMCHHGIDRQGPAV